MENNPRPIKAISATASELERARNYFRFYSPIQKTENVTSPAPKGEEWKLERTLPSGLYLWANLGEPSLLRENRFWQIPKKEPEGSDDLSSFQYDVVTHLKKHSWLRGLTSPTYSVAWHPRKPLLVTNGSNGPVKLWDVQNGRLLTKLPHRTSWPGDVACWSPDGAVFASEGRMFNGLTGETRKGLPGIGSRYSSYFYSSLRGSRDGFISANLSNNFSPWRPHSRQFVVDENVHFDNRRYNGPNQWNPSADLFGKTLVFQNIDTGEIEKVIDCDVPSQVEDFAWHPSGKFVAIAFKGHNIHIIDIDDVRTIAGLSVSRLVGWSPDGQTFIARDKSRSEFTLWNGVDGKEKPVSEEVQNQIWFKRFFNDISADGHWSIRIEISGTNIYSVETNRLIATLPKTASNAAWSPIDGGLLATCSGNNSTQLIDANTSGVESGGHTDIWRLLN